MPQGLLFPNREFARCRQQHPFLTRTFSLARHPGSCTWRLTCAQQEREPSRLCFPHPPLAWRDVGQRRVHPPRAAAVTTATAQEAPVLSFSQLYDKQVIAQADGKQLGFVDTAFIDPRTLALVSLGLKAKPAVEPFAGQRSALQLTSVSEIGDVVLLGNGSPLPTADVSQNLLPIFETDIEEANGRPIGRVVDFRFNPSTGQLCSLVYDKTSLPLPRFAVLKLVDLWSTGAQHVRSVDSERLRITLKPGHRTVRKSAGWLEWVFSRLQDIWRENGPEGDEDGLTDDDFYLYFQEQRARGSNKTWGQAWVDFCALQQAVQQQQRSSNPASALLDVGRKAASALDSGLSSAADRNMQQDPRLRRTEVQQTRQQPLSLPLADSSRDIRQWQTRQQPSKVASIPIIRPSQPYERRDVDGRFGEPPPVPPSRSLNKVQDGRRPQYADWASPSQQERELQPLDGRPSSQAEYAAQARQAANPGFLQQKQPLPAAFPKQRPEEEPASPGSMYGSQRTGEAPNGSPSSWQQGRQQRSAENLPQREHSIQSAEQIQETEHRSGELTAQQQQADSDDDLEERVARIFRQR